MTQSPAGNWTFLTNHARVLLYLAGDNEAPLREVAAAIGITERSAQRVVAELEESGFITRERAGRNNRYRIHTHRPFRHPLEQRHEIGELLALFGPDQNPGNR